MTPPSSFAEAIVVDANIMVAIAAREAATEQAANDELAARVARGCEFFAPGVLVSETLFVLCKKVEVGLLSASQQAQAIQDFHTFLSFVLPPPDGEISLVLRAEEIRGSYTCRRSADGLYIALAEMLSTTRPTTLLTFDVDMQKQAANNAPSVTVQLLTV